MSGLFAPPVGHAPFWVNAYPPGSLPASYPSVRFASREGADLACRHATTSKPLAIYRIKVTPKAPPKGEGVWS